MIPRVSVVTFKYHTPGYRTRFTSSMVNSLFKQLADHVGDNVPFEVVCITDDRKGLMSDIMYREMRPTFRNLRNPTSGSRPNCYPRLSLFDPKNPYGLQEYFISIDLDALVVGDMAPLLQHWQDFVVYKVRGHFCGSMFGGRVGGAASCLFTEFDPVKSPMLTNSRGLRGSDQAWFEYMMPHAATWTANEGVLGWQDDIGWPLGRRVRPRAKRHIVIPRNGRHVGHRPPITQVARQQAVAPPAPVPNRNPAELPPGARIVHFYGEPKAWSPEAQRMSPWITKYLR